MTDDPAVAGRIDEMVREEGDSGASASHVEDLQGLERKPDGAEPGRWDGGVVLLDLAAEGRSLDDVETVAGDLGAPTVALVTAGDDGRGEEALRRGAQDYLVRGESGAKILLRAVRHARERQALRNEARRNAALIESTLESVDEAILVVDRDGEVVLHNDRFQSLWGLDDELVATGEDDRLLEEASAKLENPEGFLEGVRELYDNPDATSLDVLRFRDGRIVERRSRPHRVDGEVVGRVWTFRDVTERERTEEALRTSEERFRSLYENTSIGLYRTTPDGQVVMANPALLDMLGYDSLAELADSDLEGEAYHPSYSREAWRERLEEEGEIRGHESTWETRDGDAIQVRESARAVRDADGEVEFYEGTIEDVTDRHEAELELERRNELLTALHEVSLRLLEHLDVDDVLEEIVERASDLLETDLGWIFLRGDDDVLRLEHTTEPLAEFRGLELEEGEGHAGAVWTAGETLAVDDYDDWRGRTTEMPEGVFSTVAGVPLRVDGEVRGVLGLGRPPEGPGFDGEELTAIERFGGLASVALANARLVDAMEAEIRERRETEDALRRSQERLREAQRVAQVGSWEWDILADEITWSDQQRRLLGVDPDDPPEPGHRDFLATVHPDDEGRVAEHFVEAAETGEFPTFEYRVERPDGSVRWMEVRGEVEVEDGEAVRMRGTNLDITDRVLPLRRYESLVETSPDAIVQANDDGEIVGWNHAAEEIFGWPEEEIVGEPLTTIMPEEYREDHREGFRRFLETGEEVVMGETLEMHGLRADGTRFPVELSIDTYQVGEARYFSAIARDVTERKEAEEALRRSEERLRDAQRVARVGSFEWHVPSDTATLSDEKARLMGLDPDGADEMGLEDFIEQIHPDDRDRVERTVEEALEEGRFPTYEFRVVDPDGTVRWLEERGTAEVEDGEVVRVRGTTLDITDRVVPLRRYEALVETSPDAIVQSDAEGRVVGWNDAAEEIFGWSRDEIVGEHLTRLLPERYREEHQDRLENLAGGETSALGGETLEIRGLRADGTEIPVEVSLETYTVGDRTFVSGIWRDVTERREAEEALRRSEERYRTLVDAAPDIIWSIGPDGSIESLNPAVEEVTGWSREELKGASFADLVHPDDLEALFAKFQSALEGQDRVEAEVRGRTKDGDYRTLHVVGAPRRVDGELQSIMGIARDITERKETQERLRRSEERYRTLVETAPDVIYTVDLDGTVRSLNQAFEDVTGWEPREWEGRSFADLVHPDDLEKAWSKLGEIAEGRDHVEAELRFRTADGDTFLAHLVGAPREVDGEVKGLIGIGRDITERKERERRLAESERRLRRAQEVGEIGDWTWDAESETISFSDQMARLWGLEPGATPDYEDVREVIHPEDREEVDRLLLEAAREGEEGEIDHRIVTPDGEVRWIRGRCKTVVEDGEIVGLRGTSQDVTESKESQRALAERTRRLETLVSNLPGVVYRCRNASGWPMSEVRGEAEELTGYPAEAIVDGDVSWGEDLIHPEDRESVASTVEEAVSQADPFEIVYRIRTADGETRWVWERGRGVDGPDPDVLEGFITDITEQREAEERLRRSEERYRRLVESAPDPICTVRPDGTFASVNEAWVEETGWTLEDMQDRPFVHVIHEDDVDETVEAFERVLDGERAEVEFRVRTADGGRFWAHGVGVPLYEDGEVDRVLAVLRDITDRKEAEERLRTVKNFNQTLLENAPVGIAHIAEDGYVTYQNQALRRIRGVEEGGQDPLLYTPFREFDPVVERPELRERVDALLDDGVPFAEYQSAFERADGEKVHLAVTGVPVGEEAGDVAGAILLARDVTEERKLEREVERQTVQLVHSEKMAALGHLVAGITHEINNPLSVVRSNTELLKEAAERVLDEPLAQRTFAGDDVEPEEVLEEVVTNPDIRFLFDEGLHLRERNLASLQRISDFIESLRTFAKPDPSHAPEDLNDVLRDTAELFLAQYREEVDLRTSYGDLPEVPCDGSQVGQVAMNLLLNAAQASPEGTPVDLRTRREGDAAVIEVEDQGDGIPPDRQDEIFDPFFTTKEDDNMGLGLSITEQIVSDHDGSIDVESTPGEGTLFRVRLPVEEGSP